MAGQKVARQAAWVCLWSNLVLPGLGTYVARRRVTGALQLIISQAGFVLSLVWAVFYARDWIRLGSLPEDISPNLGIGLLGVALFLLAWIWSLASSYGILQDSRKSGL
jgi:hypothetical protein